MRRKFEDVYRYLGYEWIHRWKKHNQIDIVRKCQIARYYRAFHRKIRREIIYLADNEKNENANKTS